MLGGLGRTFIAAGVIILLFVAYQLWGTGIQHARAQNALEGQFSELLVEAGELGEGPDAAQASSGGDDPDSSDDETEAAAADEEADTAQPQLSEAALAALLYREEGEAIAKIEIPEIGVDEVVVEGVRVDDLRKGPGHYRSTPLPGQAGNSAIAGHRTTYGAPFHRVDELQPGDEIIVTTVQGQFTYRVVPQAEGKGHFIVAPSATEVLGQNFAEAPNRITLTACHPKYSARQRIIVVGELVGEPAQTPGVAVEDPGDETLPSEDVDEPAGAEVASADGEAQSAADADATDLEAQPAAAVPVPGVDLTDSFGEGLNGDSDAIPAAVAWGLAALAIWAAAWFVGTKWRKLPMYGIALVPFLIVLFVSFVHVDQALPSY